MIKKGYLKKHTTDKHFEDPKGAGKHLKKEKKQKIREQEFIQELNDTTVDEED